MDEVEFLKQLNQEHIKIIKLLSKTLVPCNCEEPFISGDGVDLNVIRCQLCNRKFAIQIVEIYNERRPI